MVSNTGTYIDCPFHRYANGRDLSEVGLERFTHLEGVTVDADFSRGLEIGKESFPDHDLAGKAVLVRTNWSTFWRTDAYFENHPFLNEDSATYLRGRGVVLVGIDAYNIDDTRRKSRPVHSILLKEGILIVEHVCNLDKLPSASYAFSAVPPKIQGVGTFPVRAYVTMRR